MKSRIASHVLLIVLASAGLGSLFVLLPNEPIADEVIHFAQAEMFARGDWRVHPSLSTWPTTNLIVAAVLALFRSDSLTLARGIIAAFAALAALAFFRITKHGHAETAALRTAQFFLMPIVLLYCGIVYTDIPALAALLWMVWAALERRPVVFCLSALLAVAMRQNNILWLVAGLAYYRYEMRAPENPKIMRAVSGFCMAIGAGWLAAVKLLGGVALGEESQRFHNLGLRGLPNLACAVALGGILFLPIFLETLRGLPATLRKPRAGVAFLACALLIGLTFRVRHPFNTAPGLIEPFLRNRALYAITHGAWIWPFALGTCISLIAFWRTTFAARFVDLRWPVYILGVMSLVPLRLIEQRYYLPFYALFWAMRAPASERAEWLQLALGMLLSAGVIYAVSCANLFL